MLNLRNLINQTLKLLAPPPELTVSQWADKNRKLSSEASAEPGTWNTDRAPYQRGIMDAITDESTETIVLKASAQVGKSEIILNALGYFIDQDPCPILLLQPTLAMAEAFSKDRISPMLRDTPCLAEKIAKVKAKGTDNTILHKKFPGGHITLAGANSPASLASRPVRFVADDEVDRYPESAGAEGDPVDLAYKRTTTFFNRKQLLTSTPTIKGASRIDAAWEASDKRRYHVPCPDCGVLQHLRWEQIKFPDRNPENTYYECEACGHPIQEGDKLPMLRAGQWIAEKPFEGIAGFHLNELYSPWKRWSQVVHDFLLAKDFPEKFKVWVNTSLGECWEEAGETVDPDCLINRREEYAAPLPKKVLILTAAVDVQKNRLEVEIKGWGRDEENWGIEHRLILGDPRENDVWQQLDAYLEKEWLHESGITMKPWVTLIDSGYHTNQVYAFCKPRALRRVFAVKGDEGPRPIVGPAIKKRTGKNQRPVDLFILGVDQAKADIYDRLKKKSLALVIITSLQVMVSRILKALRLKK